MFVVSASKETQAAKLSIKTDIVFEESMHPKLSVISTHREDWSFWYISVVIWPTDHKNEYPDESLRADFTNMESPIQIVVSLTSIDVSGNDTLIESMDVIPNISVTVTEYVPFSEIVSVFNVSLGLPVFQI